MGSHAEDRAWARALHRRGQASAVWQEACAAAVELLDAEAAWAAATTARTEDLELIACAGTTRAGAALLRAALWPTGAGHKEPCAEALDEGRSVLLGPNELTIAAKSSPGARFRAAAVAPVRGSASRGVMAVFARAPIEPGSLDLLEQIAAEVAERLDALSAEDAAAPAPTSSQTGDPVTSTPGAVLVLDGEGSIRQLNDAFELAHGVSRSALIGRSATEVIAEVYPPEARDALSGALGGSEPWSGELLEMRDDGSVRYRLTEVTPLYGDEHEPAGHVLLERDVTHEREREREAIRLAHERTLVASAMRSLPTRGSPESVALTVCEHARQLPHAVAALAYVFESDDEAASLAVVDGEGRALPRVPIFDEHALALRGRALMGPSVDSLDGAPVLPSHPDLNSLLARRATHAACSPIRFDDQVVGALLLVGADAGDLPRQLAVVEELAELVAARAGAAIQERITREQARSRLEDVLARQAFYPTFQPIVDLRTGATVGHEALTRFVDGTPPGECFALAARAGLSSALEIATLRAAITESEQLPAGQWLHLNVSPAMMFQPDALAPLLATLTRSVVLELTEHEVIRDYAAFRKAVAALGPNAAIAIDDAGAGFASFRHIVELSPSFIKLDRSLITAIHLDTARQALIRALVQFVEATGRGLIAEGIETEPELETLRGLGVTLGQGWLIGKPARVPVSA